MNENQTSSALLRQIKKQAKEAVRVGSGQHMQILEALARKQGFSSYYALEKVASRETQSSSLMSLAKVLDPPPHSSIVHCVQIGYSIWSLRAESSGPKLSLDSRPRPEVADLANISDIGLFQVLQLAENLYRTGSMYPSQGWVVTRYGTHRCHTLDWMSDQEVKALSLIFGIPFHNEIGSKSQQRCSEADFYKSNSFRALRSALRFGRQPLPSLSKWCVGLNSLWAHLVAAPDTVFEYIDEVIEGYFGMSYGDLESADRQLSALWSQVPSLAESARGLDYNFMNIANTWCERSGRRATNATKFESDWE